MTLLEKLGTQLPGRYYQYAGLCECKAVDCNYPQKLDHVLKWKN